MSELIFYHIEKCGGSSLRNILYEYFVKIYPKNIIFIPEYSEDIRINYTPHHIEKIKQNPIYDFPNIKVILSHIRFSYFPDLSTSCKYKLTCVREPISRVISHYYFFVFPKNKIEFIDLSHKDFEYFASHQGNHISNCLDITSNSDINEIDKRLKEFNYILTIENLENDLVTLNKSLNKIYKKNYFFHNQKKNFSKKKSEIKDEKKLKFLLKKYCTIDELVYNRIMFLKNNNIIK